MSSSFCGPTSVFRGDRLLRLCPGYRTAGKTRGCTEVVSRLPGAAVSFDCSCV